MDLFFYGTLCDPDILRIVLGESPAPQRLVPARLPGYRSFWAKGWDFPFIEPGDGAAEGVVLLDVTDVERARMDYYEGGFQYTLRDVSVETDAGRQPAMVYFADDDFPERGAPWQLEDWQDSWGPISREAAREIMRYMGERDPVWVTERDKVIMARAQARVDGAKPRPLKHSTPLSASEVEVEEHTQPYADFFTLERFRLRHPRHDGGLSDVMDRAVFIGFDAALCLPYDPVRDRVLLVEQFRVGAFARHDPTPWLLEPVAGLIDPGETPEDTCRREAVEETGVELKSLHLAGRGYASPGANTSYFHSFVGIADLPELGEGRGGLHDEGEDIRTIVLPFQEVEAAIASGEANVIPLQHLVYWLAANKDRLVG